MPRLSLRWGSEEFELFPQRALFWPSEEMLLAADLHIGKPAAFRAFGMPVPDGTTASTLRTLSQLLEATRAARLCILGDLLHSRAGRDAATLWAVEQWRASHPKLEFVLVRGNHDRSAGDPPDSWRVECCDGPMVVRDVALLHDPDQFDGIAGRYIAGHVHPVMTLHDNDGTSLRMPCFCFGRRRGLLPAFGAFTGGGQVSPGREDRIFLAGDGHVIEAPLPARVETK